MFERVTNVMAQLIFSTSISDAQLDVDIIFFL